MKILLVDDDPQGLEQLRELLETTPGNEIRTAPDGDRALEIAREWGDCELLITGVYLEPMNGFTLRNKTENRFAGVKTIFMTAADVSDYREHWEGYEVLNKPFTRRELFAAIARTFATKP